MSLKNAVLAAAISLPFVLAGCNDGSDGDDGAPGPQGEQGPAGTDGQDANRLSLSITLMGRYETGLFDESAAEIVDFDPSSGRAYVVNANSGQVDVLDASTPYTPTLTGSLNVAEDVSSLMGGVELGAANSVAVHGSLIAVAIEADNKQDNGYVAFYQTDGTFLSAVAAGALPDMVTFTPDGSKVLVANEGEPNGDYSVDPEGSVTVVDVSQGATAISDDSVTQIRFSNLNASDLIGPVRISAKSASIAADLEPEYITVSSDGQTAYVALQENNAVAIINLNTNNVESIQALGFKNYAIPGNEFDASNRDGGVNIRSWPVYGTYMPDSMDSFTSNGVTYLVTANEGDGREYLTNASDEADCAAQGGFDFDDGDCFHYLDEIRIKDIEDSGASFSEDLLSRLSNDFAEDENLGRLKVIANLGTSGACSTLATTGQPSSDCVYNDLYSYGARSFTVWNTSTMQPVFDSGNEFEVITANRLGDSFNASNDDNEGDDRSDDKGPEPEAIEVANIGGKTFVFVGLERVGGIMVYDLSNPEAGEFVQYINPRDFAVSDVENDLALVGDLGPESIKFVAAEDSPTGSAMLIVGNEVSGTTSFFDIQLNGL